MCSGCQRQGHRLGQEEEAAMNASPLLTGRGLPLADALKKDGSASLSVHKQGLLVVCSQGGERALSTWWGGRHRLRAKQGTGSHGKPQAGRPESPERQAPELFVLGT